jgi:hypothetical protein
MKGTIRVLTLVLLFALTATADASGSWNGTFTLQGAEPQDMFLILQENVGRITGSGGSSRTDQNPIRYGSVEAGKLSLEIAGPDGATLVLKLTQSGESMTGTVEFQVGTDTLTGTVDLKRGE